MLLPRMIHRRLLTWTLVGVAVTPGRFRIGGLSLVCRVDQAVREMAVTYPTPDGRQIGRRPHSQTRAVPAHHSSSPCT